MEKMQRELTIADRSVRKCGFFDDKRCPAGQAIRRAGHAGY
jgi:hypothetical protein